ncbi:MAG: hypothetical protein AB3N14_13175 [Flavobacteriaceae bacterium]
MKNVIVTMALMVGLVGFAQRGEHRGMSDLSPEQMAILQTKKLTLALDLSEDQQEVIQELSEENAIALKERIDARKASREEGKEKPSSEERFNKQVERLDRAIAHKAKMKEILTEEQYQKWEKMQARKGHQRKTHKKSKRSHRHKRE